jgi:hypothetical protein
MAEVNDADVGDRLGQDLVLATLIGTQLLFEATNINGDSLGLAKLKCA